MYERFPKKNSLLKIESKCINFKSRTDPYFIFNFAFQPIPLP